MLTRSLKLLLKHIHILTVLEDEANLVLQYVLATSHKGQTHRAPVVKEKPKTARAQNRSSLPKITFAVTTHLVAGVVLVKPE